MLHAPAELERFHQLLKKGFHYSLFPGLTIGRGFADAGFEEYSVLSGKSAISLNTGKLIGLDEFYQNYYFPILTVDQLSKELYSRGWDIVEVSFQEQRIWKVVVSKDKNIKQASNSLLLVCFVDLLLLALE